MIPCVHLTLLGPLMVALKHNTLSQRPCLANTPGIDELWHVAESHWSSLYTPYGIAPNRHCCLTCTVKAIGTLCGHEVCCHCNKACTFMTWHPSVPYTYSTCTVLWVTCLCRYDTTMILLHLQFNKHYQNDLLMQMEYQRKRRSPLSCS